MACLRSETDCSLPWQKFSLPFRGNRELQRSRWNVNAKDVRVLLDAVSTGSFGCGDEIKIDGIRMAVCIYQILGSQHL
jgi:hypothetical protein